MLKFYLKKIEIKIFKLFIHFFLKFLFKIKFKTTGLHASENSNNSPILISTRRLNGSICKKIEAFYF
jgi:hypothetical protein